MNKTARYATKKDAEAGHKFCVIRIEISRHQIMIQRMGDLVPCKIGKENTYRFGCLGAIDWVALGEVRVQSAGGYEQTAHIIDYVGNAAECMQTAKAYVESTRKAFVESLESHAEDLMIANVVVQ